MEYVIETLQADWEMLLRFSPRLLYAAMVLASILVVSIVVDRFAGRLLSRSKRFRSAERFVRLVLMLFINSVGLLIALGTLGLHGVVASLLASGGVLAIVLGFAFKEIGENFLAGFFLSFSRPFPTGGPDPHGRPHRHHQSHRAASRACPDLRRL